MAESNIRKQVLFPLTLTFLVLLGAFLYSGIKIRQNNVAAELDYRYLATQNLFYDLLAGRLEMMATVIEPIARDAELQSAMLARDRSTLLRVAGPIMKNLNSRHGITHFYFHTTDGVAFLRQHKPESYGDKVKRSCIRQALEGVCPAQGLELGVFGTFILRYVQPWYQDGVLLGYIELGEEIDHILKKLKAIAQVDFVITIDKQELNRELWQTGMRMVGRQGDWDLLPEKVVIDQTVNFEPAQYAALVSPQSRSEGERWDKIEQASQTFAYRAFPLRNGDGRVVGDFVLLSEISHNMRAFNYFILRIVAFGLFLSTALFIFAYRLLGRTDCFLATSRQKLLDEVDNATRMNTQLEREVADRRRIEEDLKNLNENLEQRVVERTRRLEALNFEIRASREELEQAYRDLQAKQATILHQDKMACIGQLAAGVAHDINNPIGFVANNLEELEEYLFKLRLFLDCQEKALQRVADPQLLIDLAAEKERLQLDFILADLDTIIKESQEGAERISNIVQNLGTFSRVDDVAWRLADLNECLESTIHITANELRYKAVVSKEYGPIPAIRCCPQQLNQVFMNLLINAAQAIEKQGEVTVRSWAEGGSVCISIADTGCGIAPENLRKIFDPFFTTKEVGKGTGLGLSITYDIIRKHQGEILVNSELGLGTTFTIRLPALTGDCDG